METISKQSLAKALERLTQVRDDEQAWKIVFKAAWGTGLSAANRVLRGQLDLAKDVTQEAFQRLIRYSRFEQLQDPDEFLGYFRAVCQNVARDALRRLAPELESNVPLEEFQILVPQQNWPATPEQLVSAEQLKHNLLSDLKPDDQALMNLLLDGYSLEEMALTLGLSYENAGVRLHRLRGTLRKHMKKDHL